jgi:hypothetical protein
MQFYKSSEKNIAFNLELSSKIGTRFYGSIHVFRDNFPHLSTITIIIPKKAQKTASN